MIENIVRFVRRTPARTFVIYPVVVLTTEAVRRRGGWRLAWQFAPLLAWGYLQYRLCGSYRRALGGGGPGIDVPPRLLVTTGPYSVVRNPMYLGHIIFLAGVALLAQSWVGAAIAAATAWWFNRRVEEDEARLAQQFGEPYASYLQRVPRWIPSLRIFAKRSGEPAGWPTHAPMQHKWRDSDRPRRAKFLPDQ